MNSSLKNILLVGVVVLLFLTVFNNYILARPLGSNGDSFFPQGSCCAPGAPSRSQQQQCLENNNSNGFFSGGSCCAPPGGGAQGLTRESLQEQGLAYYASRTGETAEEAIVKDFGCHQEIFIYKDGELMMRLAYAGGNFFEI